MIRRQECESGICFPRSFFLAGALCWNIERRESNVSRCEKKLKDNLNDEIKLADLEALVREELEKHLVLNSNRLRTFGDALGKRDVYGGEV